MRAIAYASAAVFVVALALLLWYALTYVLLAFFAVLLALLLRAPTDWLAERTPIPPMAALALVVVALLGLLGGAGVLFGQAVTEQTIELGERLPQVVQSILDRMRESTWGQRVLDLWSGGEPPSGAQVVGGAMRFVGSALEIVSQVAVLVFLAAFFAIDPKVYVRGICHLVPKARRARIAEVLGEIGDVLQRWLVGQAILMLAIGVLTYIGLMLAGAPLALPLAILAGIVNFIPYLGPIIAAVPAVLVGFSESPEVAGYVVLVYLIVQTVEGYVLEPLIQRRAVFVPPATIIAAQVLLTLVAGPVGTMVATPFAAALLVAVRMLYVEDALGDRGA